MKKLVFFLTLLLSLTNLFSQENPIYGSKVIVRKRDTSSAEFQIINSTRNVSGFLKNTGGGNTIFKIPSQSEIAALPDSLLARYTKTQADARFKSISYIPDWLELTGVPSNFSTTYALSNDIQDSLLNKVSRSGSYADPSWITSINYSKLVGTVPTWNQNTTGNAATVTNGVYTTGSYTNPAWIVSLDYSKLTGTVPTWNQNTTGNAATVTNGVYTTGSYANPTWITSLDYSKLTGTIPTWNQNTTGNAATVTNGVYTTGSYADPSWITSLGWSKISGAPAFITGINSSMVTTALGYTPENISNKGIANGYADLDVGGKIPASRIDFGQTGQTFVVASQAAMLAVSGANIGALAVRTDESKNYRLIAQPASTLGNWQLLLSPDAPVQSVNGYTGNVNLLTTHISEGSNYWWTAARSRAAQSLTTTGNSGSATYDNSTGVLNVPTYTLAGLGGISLTSLSFTPGSGGYNSSTGVITIPTNTNQLTNGAGFITGYTETDPTIYAWAKAATKPSYIYSEIGGTVPTWNQSTTGNAATATIAANSTLLQGFSATVAANANTVALRDGSGYLRSVFFYDDNTAVVGSGITSMYGGNGDKYMYKYSAAAVQTFLGLGSAAYTASSSYYSAGSTVANSNLWGGLSFLDVNLTTPSYVLTSTGGGEYKYSTIAQIMSAAGLGSYAYRSSGLAELSGANFTGDINGTNATFNGNITLQVGANRHLQIGSATSYYWRLKSVNDNFLINMGADALTAAQFIYPTGAVEFYGGITNSNSNSYIRSISTVAANDAVVSAQWGDGNGMHMKYNPSIAVGYIQNSYPVFSGQPYGDIHIRQNLAGSMTTRMLFKGETGFIGINSISPDAPLHINGGPSMTGGWNRTLTLQSTFPSIVFNSANQTYAGIAYDYSSNMIFRVGANTNDIFSSGVMALILNSSSGAASFGSSVTANGLNANSGWNITLSGGDIYFNNNGGYGLLSQNAARQLAVTNSGITIPQHLSVGNRAALTPSNMGYSSSYKTLIVGSTGTNYISDATSLAFNVDLSGNPSGSFTGNGFEYFWRNTGEFRTPNAANNGFNILYSWNSSGEINIPNPVNLGSTTVNGIAAVTNYVSAPNFYTGTGGYFRVSGGSGVYWEDYQTRLISTSLYYTQSWSDNGIIIANRSGTAKGYIYHDGSGFGLLHSAGGWALRVNTGTSGGELYGSWSVGNLTATNFIRSGGTSSQFLKADGSIDANTYATTASLSSYATTSSLSGYVDISNNQYEIGGNKTFLADVVVNGKLTGSRLLGNTATYTSAATISSSITTAFCSNSSGSNYTLTMPSASGVTGQIMTVILTSGTLANTVTLSGINGGSYVLTCYASVVLVSDGSTWKIASVYNNTAPCS